MLLVELYAGYQRFLKGVGGWVGGGVAADYLMKRRQFTPALRCLDSFINCVPQPWQRIRQRTNTQGGQEGSFYLSCRPMPITYRADCFIRRLCMQKISWDRQPAFTRLWANWG